MAEDTVEILLPEVTLNKQVAVLTDRDNNVTGRQNGMGKTWFYGERVPVSEVSPDYLEALDNEDHPSHEAVSKRIKRSTGSPEQDEARRLGIPFDGYDDLDEEQILALFVNLPSAAQQRVKEWESKRENPRGRIVNYNSGFGESPEARQAGEVNSGVSEEVDDNKAVRSLKTREVPDGEAVVSGEGVTGTGEPAGGTDGGEASGSTGPKRRGRRQRPTRPAADSSDASPSSE